MHKIGKHRNPSYVLILTLATFSLFTIIWICIVLVELRKYRKKGINGYVVSGIVVLVAGSIFYFENTTPIVAGIIVIIMLLFCFEPLFFYISNITGKEINKLKGTDKGWEILGLIPTVAVILTFVVVPYLSVYPMSGGQSWLEANDEGLVLLLGIILVAVWVFIMQKLLNSLWKLGDKSQTMAIPEIADSESSDTVSTDKDESDE